MFGRIWQWRLNAIEISSQGGRAEAVLLQAVYHSEHSRWMSTRRLQKELLELNNEGAPAGA